MSAAINTHPKQAQSELSHDDLETLRNLLLGPEYKELLRQKNIQEDPALLAEHMSSVITQALKTREKDDGSILKFFTPILQKSLSESVTVNPKPIADALYPIIGPAIRKSINVSISQMVLNMNELLENSLSPKSFRWRFDAWRTGKSYAEVVFTSTLVFQVEQVFLVHRETGLLLQHVVTDNAVSKDPDLISSMLTAIQDFLRDSFTTEKDSDLDTLKLGDLTLLIEYGPTAVIAAVVRGIVPSGMHLTLSETMEAIHQEESLQLDGYDGDSSQFDHLQPLLMNCIKKQSRETPDKAEEKLKESFSKKQMIFVGIGFAAIVGIAYLSYSNYVENKQWNKLQQVFRSEPGIILSHTAYENGTYQLHGLADSTARSPESLINEYALNKLSVKSNFRPYLSLEPELVQQRIEKALLPPPTIQLNLNDEVLYVSGFAEPKWLEQLKINAPLFAGVNSINLDKLETIRTQ
ncbi:hypothetical protein [Leucothrix arctica]|uniref:Flagellar motor protein MotB n=1 Tax=Leucothrix arctica TaxID=1481894 RepID=A0A317CLF6_9GAMM|nr:hypothetical protein [Leucothrix arctica]PWQ98273.1 hypothetical protein DKT75_03840 [Leucothrix arctica]